MHEWPCIRKGSASIGVKMILDKVSEKEKKGEAGGKRKNKLQCIRIICMHFPFLTNPIVPINSIMPSLLYIYESISLSLHMCLLPDFHTCAWMLIVMTVPLIRSNSSTLLISGGGEHTHIQRRWSPYADSERLYITKKIWMQKKLLKQALPQNIFSKPKAYFDPREQAATSLLRALITSLWLNTLWMRPCSSATGTRCTPLCVACH